MNQSERKHYDGEIVTMREYIDLRFADFQRAIDKAETAMTARLAGMNEFRDQLRDQASKFVTRAELDIHLQTIQCAIDDLKKSRDQQTGRVGASAVYIAYGISAVSLILAALAILLRG